MSAARRLISIGRALQVECVVSLVQLEVGSMTDLQRAVWIDTGMSAKMFAKFGDRTRASMCLNTNSQQLFDPKH